MTDLKKDIKRVMGKYPGLKFSTIQDARDFVNIHNILEATLGKVDSKILLGAYLDRRNLEPKTVNDYYYLVTKAVIQESKIKKMAYPMGFGALSEDSIPEADLDLWVSLVHKIYKAVESGEMSFRQALEYYSKQLNEKNGEPERFAKWVLYYKNGEHEKYAKEDEVNMKKKSDYQFGLNSSSYPRKSTPVDESVQGRLEALDEQSKKEEEFEVWKSKINGAIRRIDKLLRTDEHLSPEEQTDLAEMLHAFDLQVRRIRLQSLAEDVTFLAANKFKKVGFDRGSDILIKTAQELGEGEAEAPLPPPEEPPAAPANVEPAAEAPAPAGPSETIGRALETGETDEGRSGDVFDELTQMGGNIDLSVAANKLEEVAARLADRRTIRQLAEFDIMLDKLGIAALFPELSEAQSKLIDAYSYALVRVTKMLGMLSSGKSMVEISDAKKTDIANRAVKEINKTLTQGEEPVAGGKGTEAINQEFGPAEGGQEAQPEPVV
nr:hypothetical protein 47 [bacterium]